MKKFMLSLDEKLHQELKIKAIQQGKNMNELIVKAVEKELKANKK
jgi:predicted HicB family RNase H-like nuclease